MSSRSPAERGVASGWTLRAKSIALLGGYALFLTTVYAGFTIFLLRRERATAEDRLGQTARLVAAEIDMHLETGEQRLATVAQLPGLVHGLHRIEEAEGDGGYIPPWTTLHYLFFKSPVFTGGVFLLDRAGKVLWTEPPGLPWLGANLSDHPAIAAMYRAGPVRFSAGLAPDQLLAAPHVMVGYPIAGPDGEPTGLLGGVIDLTATGFTGILQAISTAEGRYLSIVDQAGRVISSTDSSQLLGHGPDLASGTGAWLAAAALEDAPWRVVAGESEETALAPVRQLQRVLLGLGVAMLLVATAVGSGFVGAFMRAIQRLTSAAETMAGGDLSQPVAIDDRQLELATLGRTFERMRVELRRSHAALTQRLSEREDLIRLKEEFLANVSHELRTPLNVIFGYTEVLVDDEGDAQRRDLLDRIRGQSGQLLQLVGDLMTLSGLSTGKIAVELAPVRVADVLDRIRPLTEQLARGKPIALGWDCAPSMPSLVTDGLRLEQVLTNLVTNAFKFTSEGSIAIRTRIVAGGARVAFDVVDTGIGIPPSELPHVFDEFRQVDGSMSRRHGGMGLGLALVSRLVDLLAGEVSVTSVPGRGSTFTVTLPVRHPSAPAVVPNHAA